MSACGERPPFKIDASASSVRFVVTDCHLPAGHEGDHAGSWYVVPSVGVVTAPTSEALTAELVSSAIRFARFRGASEGSQVPRGDLAINPSAVEWIEEVGEATAAVHMRSGDELSVRGSFDDVVKELAS